jgi:hypothetical protein
MVRYVLLFALVAFVTTCTALTKPTAAQIRMMDMGLSQFMHFSVDPFTSIEHNCVGTSSDCIPASTFNPTNLSTDQWVETAVAFGAEEICLTAHHEGGFCLWDTKYSNYSVMHSPYGKDVVKQFVASCQKYGVKPCCKSANWSSIHIAYPHLLLVLCTDPCRLHGPEREWLVVQSSKLHRRSVRRRTARHAERASHRLRHRHRQPAMVGPLPWVMWWARALSKWQLSRGLAEIR